MAEVREKSPEEKKLKCDIERSGTKIILPEIPVPGMSYRDAITVLQDQMKADEEKIVLNRTYDCMPWDGAIALMKALERIFGWVHTKPIPGFFGDKPPTFKEVPIGPNGEVTQVIWGRMCVKNLDSADVYTGADFSTSVPRFVIQAEVKRRFQGSMTNLFDEVTKIVNAESIYKGKAFNIEVDDNGAMNIQEPPRFMDTSHTNVNGLIFSHSLEADIQANLFTPIMRSADCRAAGIPIKRGILFEGPYGVGKSLTASVTAKRCVENGWTFVNVKSAMSLGKVFEWARMFAPVVIFCEDIDRSMEGDRDVAKDAILNVVDGVQHKHAEIILVLTTNHVDKINRAMLRPGRFDAVISIQPPDAEAAVRLVRLYAGSSMDKNEDLEQVGQLLAGQIPATIAEVTKRAKLFCVSRTKQGETIHITAEDVLLSAESMKRHLELLNGKESAPTPAETLWTAMQKMVDNAVVKSKTGDTVEAIREHFGVEA